MTIPNLLIIYATALFICLALHDLVDLPPLTNLRDLKAHESDMRRYVDSIINGLCGLIPLVLLVLYNPTPPIWAYRTILSIYAILLTGAFCAWWIPYFFGSPKEHRNAFEKFKNTHHFLPARGENVIPNTFHALLHLLMLVCFLLAVKL